MTITPSRIAYSDTAASGSDDTLLTVGVAIPTGTWLVAIIGTSGGTSTIGLSDSKTNTWTQRKIAPNSNSPSAVVAIYTTQLTTALTATDTLRGTSTAGSGCGDILLIQVTPTAGATLAYGTGAVGTGTGTAPATASFTPGASSITIAGLCASSATLNTNTSAGSGFTKIAGGDAHTQNRSVVAQYGTTAAATTAPFTMSAGQQWAAAAITLVETGGGGGGPGGPPTGNGEFCRGSYNSTTTKTITIPVTAAVAVGEQAVLAVDCPAGGGANTTFIVTDTKGNTWTQRALVVQATTGGNGQVAIVGSVVSTALTTSDTLTVTVNNFGAIIWCWIGMHFVGTTGFDVAATNAGATTKNLDTGTTATAAQNIELLVAVFGYTGTGIGVTALPSGFIAQPIQSTTGTIRNLCFAWGFVSAAGTRHVAAITSDNASHAWCGAIAAYKSIAPPPAAVIEYIWDGIAFAPAKTVI